MKASELIEKLQEHPDWDVFWHEEYKDYVQDVYSVHEYHVNGDGMAYEDEELEELKQEYEADGQDFSEARKEFEKGFVLF